MAGYQIAQLPGLKLISGRTSDVKKPDIRSSQGNDYSEDYQKKESYPINNSFHDFFFFIKNKGHINNQHILNLLTLTFLCRYPSVFCRCFSGLAALGQTRFVSYKH